MERREFIKKVGLTAAAVGISPYILPQGRLFAASGSRKVNHVVFCLYAGGVRNIESVKQEESNLLETMLHGNFDPNKNVAINEILPPSPLGSSKLQEFGTLLKEFRFKEGPTGHYNGHATALTGRYYGNNINIQSNPDYPTVFEYYRKHNSPSQNALNSWWLSDSLGPYAGLNYSKYSGYGSLYGANFIQPTSFVSTRSKDAIGNPLIYHQNEITLAEKIRKFHDDSFQSEYQQNNAGIVNNADDAELLRSFIGKLYSEADSGIYDDPYGFGKYMNSDLYNIFFAEKIIQEFQPELLVVNLTAVDVCHTEFTSYCNNMRRADWGVSHLWNTIQNTPGMTDDTVLIVVPEHGRNLNSNTIVDKYGRFAYDHTAGSGDGDNTSREIFALICGPNGVVNQNNVVNTEYGESIDIVPTIADLLGFDSDIPGGMLPGKFLSQAFL